MNEYTIYCTESQTKKARELGAPIEVKSIENAPKDWQGKAYFTGMATCAKFPTAEQMIGWLEAQGLRISIYGHSCYISQLFDNSVEKYFKASYSRKEATLSAIDAALEYLSNNKK